MRVRWCYCCLLKWHRSVVARHKVRYLRWLCVMWLSLLGVVICFTAYSCTRGAWSPASVRAPVQSAVDSMHRGWGRDAKAREIAREGEPLTAHEVRDAVERVVVKRISTTLSLWRMQHSINPSVKNTSLNQPVVSPNLNTTSGHLTLSGTSSHTLRRNSSSHIPPSSISASPVLDVNRIKIMPKSPILIPEGHSLQVTCASIQLLRRQEQNAPYMTFRLPSMPFTYERKIIVSLRPGAAVLKFAHVSRKHGGVYTCLATDATGKQTYNRITINVIKKEHPDEGGDDVDVSRDDLPHVENMEEEDWLEVLEQLQDANDQHKNKGGDHVNEDREMLSAKLKELKQRFHANVSSAVNMQQLINKGKFQQRQVDKFCRKYNLSHTAGQLPSDNSTSSTLNRHVLVNDKAQTLFCFAPKTGCTNLRIIFFLVMGYIPLSQVVQSRDEIDQNRLESVQFLESFFSRNDNQKLYALKHYFKFVMYRNPLERLVSGYRSKVARYPLIGLNEKRPHFNWLRKAILLETQPEMYRIYLHNRGKIAINITFSNFIEFWLKQPAELKYDEHFRSVSSLCQPCRTQFSFYANFKNFDVDSQMLIQKIGARPEILRNGYYEANGGEDTASLARRLYSELTEKQKQQVVNSLVQELDFYYHIFPEEVNCHKVILSMDSDLPIRAHA